MKTFPMALALTSLLTAGAAQARPSLVPSPQFEAALAEAAVLGVARGAPGHIVLGVTGLSLATGALFFGVAMVVSGQSLTLAATLLACALVGGGASIWALAAKPPPPPVDEAREARGQLERDAAVARANYRRAMEEDALTVALPAVAPLSDSAEPTPPPLVSTPLPRKPLNTKGAAP